jgi:putative FmdB family regulatory protein
MRPDMEMSALPITAIAVGINMPKYDYKCEGCSSVVEITRSFDEDSSPMCTSCNSTMVRQWSATPAIFRGGGWGGK